MTRTRRVADELDANDVSFDPETIAQQWVDFNEDGYGIPAEAAVAIISEWYDEDATVEEAVESDRDVLFPECEILVEEKAMGVCQEETAKAHAAGYFPLDRDDGRVLALNGAAVYEDWNIPEPLCEEHERHDEGDEEADAEAQPA